MTTLYENQDTCAICGEISQHQAVGSTSRFGAPDLDLRPPEMIRSAIQYVMRRCPSCGYCAIRLSELLAGAKDVVRQPEYRQQLVDGAFPELANSFLCWSLILEAGRRYADAGWAVVQAAWVCDDHAAVSSEDAGANEVATSCRLRAVELLKRAQGNGEMFFVHAPGGQQALMADLLRRSGQFDEARAECDRGLHAQATKSAAHHDDAMTDRVLRFQLTLATRGDAACHTLSELPRDKT